MDYFTVALTSNLTAFISTGLLLLILGAQSIKQYWKRLLLIGVSGQFLWVSTLLISYSTHVNSLILLNAEMLRLSLWLVSLFMLLSKRTAFVVWPRKSQVLAIASVFVALFGFYSISTSSSSVVTIRLTLIAQAILCLVFTEQVVRNLNTHRMMKLFGLCMTFLFAFDVISFGQGLITITAEPILVQGRTALAFSVAVALAIGTLIFSEQNDSKYLFTVSRPAAFFSTAVLFSILLIGIVALGTLFLRNQGYLGTYLFALALLAAMFLLFVLIISRAFRQHFEVFISKHFFALKYDYRMEWLNAIRKLSLLKSDHAEYYGEILDILQTAVRSPQGHLWINQGSELKAVAGSLNLPNAPSSLPINEPFIRTMLKESWIFAPHSRATSLAKNNRQLPEWITLNDQVWLIAPMIIQMKLVGFVILSKPVASNDITFEDRDLMMNISTQVASQILLQQQEKVISDSRQMETYNRLSAFIMHDVNNVIAQLALIGKNAERHKKNPAFVDDMIKTVHNATSRMQGFIQKFNPASKESRSFVPVKELLSDLKESVAGHEPAPSLDIVDDFYVDADKQRLTLALKNLVRNAQEATDENGLVLIKAHKTPHGEQIVIEDNGHGMSQRFIDEELFRPFSTTKDEKGVGIGAYLTKSYIEHLGAILNVQSKEGEGTRFEITFN